MYFLPITSGDLCNDHLTSSSLVTAAKGNYGCTTVDENHSKMSHLKPSSFLNKSARVLKNRENVAFSSFS